MSGARRVGQRLRVRIEDAAPVAALDAALVASGALAAFTDEVVLWFHAIFVLLTFAALVLPLRPLLWRVAIWVPAVIVLILRAAAEGTTTTSELIEIPLLSAILVLVFLGAQRREHTVQDLRAAQAELESRADAERAEFERQLGRAQQFEAFGQLSIGVAHDFNNVVTALLGGVEELVDELSGRQAQRVALELFAQLQRARSLMDELARYAREPAAGVDRCDLGEVVAELRPMLLRLTRMDAHLELHLHAGSVIVALGRSQVDQIVVNLVLNALEALRPGGRIRIETRDSQRPAADVGPDASAALAGVTLTVTDDGAGIHPEVLPHVFDAGFSTKAEPRNLGMGLMSVRRIVAGAGGTIEIDSDLGVGTAVRMWLPVVPAGAPVVGEDAGAPLDPPGGSELLLLAEDDTPVRNRVAGILRAAGYRVVAVEDGAAAVVAGAESRPDGLVTDLSMPRMSGLALCEELRRHQPDLPVLLMSGFAFQQEAEELASPVGLLQKPFTRSELLEAVRRLLDEPARSAVADR